ncbi:hypothetical protein ScFU97_16820 [Streptococcus canis]|uniref:NAD(P)H-dependent oxidoreductase n=1 Tax=Streptococcus canis TaxID=1329 RepID=UPI0010CA21C6|nr:NAD(P)H-dependent oxidoreductase [Streptococcus canis]GFG48343.1 hypothetical protein ScFU97_16820 [Streptococcus canis]VTR80165.1 NADPH-dependent FMN reductase [Streptococcus canis]
MLPFFPEDIQVSLSCIEGLSLFDPDIDKEGRRSVSYDHFRRTFTTKTYHSRYNQTLPAALKNAIEVGPRPYQQVAFSGKAAMIISQSNDRLDGFGTKH